MPPAAAPPAPVAAPEIAVPAAEDPWSAPPPPEPVSEWQPEAAQPEWQEMKKPEAAALPVAAGADWSSLSSGPDWSAPPANAPETPADAWGVPPPAAETPQWSAAPPPPPAAEEWSAPPAPAAEEWLKPIPAAEPPPQAAPAPGPAWNAPAVGASALEQLDSEPPEPEPGAAQELFGSVPAGESLSAENDDEFAPSDDLGPPVELVSPEEVLRPLDIDHEDPDLPVALDANEAPHPKAQPLAALRPAAAGALEVHGEHRVAVHTRGGRTLRGTLHDVDLSKSQFPLAPQGGSGPETIYHSDVKAIFFMLAPGEKPHRGNGAKVRVTFSDGRVIEGTREGPDAKHGFFLVPTDAARTNTRRIYVARDATSEIEG